MSLSNIKDECDFFYNMFGIDIIRDLFKLGPTGYFKEKFKVPLIAFVDSGLDVFKAKTKTGITNTKELIIKGSIVAFITSSLVWLSIFMYLAFYYTYVPSIAHERAVYFKFNSIDEEQKPQTSLHSHLTAHVELTKRQQLLMMGQRYRIQLELEMPESPANKDHGMFMVCAEFFSKNRAIIAQSCRSTMLHYKSPIHEFLYTIFFSPFFLMGSAEEKQNLHVDLFTNYEEFEAPAVTDVFIEIQSKYIEVYSAKFLIYAELSGLRYFMFNWPLLSAGIGISSNLFFIAIICLITWYQLIHSEEYQKFIQNKNKQVQLKENLEEDNYSSSSIEDIYEKYEPSTNGSESTDKYDVIN